MNSDDSDGPWWLQCFVLDKFEPYDTEEDLIAASLNYIEDQKLWAGMTMIVIMKHNNL